MTNSYDLPPTPPTPPTMGWVTTPPPPKKKSNKVRNIAIGAGVVIALLFAYGAGSSGDVQQGFEDGVAAAIPTASAPEPTEVATPTEELTAEPTEEPTPEPTEEPTPEPTLDTGGFMDFLSKGMTYSEDVGDALTELSSDLELYDVDGATATVKRLLALHKGMAKYLDNNPPVACYAKNHAALERATAHYIKGSEAQLRWLKDFPYGSDKDFDTFINQNEQGTKDLSGVTDPEPTCF